MLKFIKEAPDIVKRLSPKKLKRYREYCIKSADKKI